MIDTSDRDRTSRNNKGLFKTKITYKLGQNKIAVVNYGNRESNRDRDRNRDSNRDDKRDGPQMMGFGNIQDIRDL